MTQKFFTKKKLLPFYYFPFDAFFYTKARRAASYTPILNGGDALISWDVIFVENNSINQSKETYTQGINTPYGSPNNNSLWTDYNEVQAENENKIKEKSSQYGSDVLQKNMVVRHTWATNETSPKTLKNKGIGAGYYLIANVFSNPKNRIRVFEPSNSYRPSASYFITPENKLEVRMPKRTRDFEQRPNLLFSPNQTIRMMT